MSDWNQETIDEFRANEGNVGGIFEGVPLLLLHSAGAKTGSARVHPLFYQIVDEGFAVFASKGGAPANPDWFYNVVANPSAKVEIGTETVAVKARVADGDEHDRIWDAQTKRYPQFGEYLENTSRDRIPVVVLEKAS